MITVKVQKPIAGAQLRNIAKPHALNVRSLVDLARQLKRLNYPPMAIISICKTVSDKHPDLIHSEPKDYDKT